MANARHVKKANIEYHSKMADEYDTTQPHFSPDNILRMERIIPRLSERSRGKGVVLDVGCGTGFLMKISEKYFAEVYGVDISHRMVEKIPKSRKLVSLLADSENLPFRDNFFDVCMSYSFLHHLYDLRPTLKEIYRVLKPGGIYFNDQDFNREYFELAEKIAKQGKETCSELKTREKQENEVHFRFKIPRETIRLAEFQELEGGGFTAKELEEKVREAGFREVAMRPRWFIGQARIQLERGETIGQEIDAYLLGLLPTSASFFKYLSFEATK